MSLYIYCPRLSTGALELVRGLDARRLRDFDGRRFWNKKAKFLLKEGDSVICWGASLPEMEGVKVLNSVEKAISKREELRVLNKAGIPTVRVFSEAVGIRRPAGVIGRKSNHIGGTDLIHSPAHPDYYVYREQLTQEFRIHSFDGRSIRAGVKVPRDGFIPVAEDRWRQNAGQVHPWIRSFDAGWRVNYDQFRSDAKMRKLAHRAVSALGLTFGAVDLGMRSDGVLIVLEVNRAPGIEGGTIAAYIRAIQRWLSDEKGKNNDDRGNGRGPEPEAAPF